MTIRRALGYFFREALSDLWKRRTVNIVSVAAIGASLYVVGLFFLIILNVGRLVSSWAEENRISVYLSDTCSEAERLVSEELRGDGCVDQIRCRETEVAIENAQVVVRAVKHLRDVGVRQQLTKEGQIQLSQRIDDEIFFGNGDLDKAHLIEVRMQRIGFGIHRNDRLSGDTLHGPIERLLCVDPDHNTNSCKPIEVSFLL